MRCVSCGQRAVHRHHVITRRHAEIYRIDINDPANLIPLCVECHFSHHRALPKLRVSVLPPETVAWIESHNLGWYITRYYEQEAA